MSIISKIGSKLHNLALLYVGVGILVAVLGGVYIGLGLLLVDAGYVIRIVAMIIGLLLLYAVCYKLVQEEAEV